MTELLAPAGSLDALYAAVNAGADAVYVGGRMFGARAYADNPDETELIKGIEYCHLRGKKVYLTVNTLLKERELFDELISFLMPLYRHGLDAVIVQDLGVLSLIKTYFPDLDLHASTQMSVTTPEGAAFLAGHGVCRVVPARELSLTEIQAIVRSGMEVETFIHGSMCYSYSGRCLLSSMLGGRSGNRGRCAQPCRLPYAAETVSDQQNEKMQHLHKISSAKECILSMKDLCTLDLLPDLMDAGIASFKIEGRMKRPEYTAGVTSVYREYMDRYAALGRKDYQVQEKDRKSLLDLFDRGGFSQGYYHMLNGPAMIAKKRPKEESLQAAQSRNERNQRFLKENSKVKINGDLRIYRDSPVILELWLAGSRREDKYWIEVSGEIPLSARTMAASKEEVARQMRKTGGTAFEFEQLNITLEDGLFLPVRMLNELRREGIRKLQEKILFERGARQTEASEETPCSEEGECSDVSENSGMEEISEIGHISEISDASPRFTILVTLASQLNAVLHWLDTRTEMGQLIDAVYLDSALLGDAGEMNENCSFLMKKAAKIKDRGIRCFFVLPPVLRQAGVQLLRRPAVCAMMQQMDGFLIHTVDELSFLKKYSFQGEFVSEDSLYSFNSEARRVLREEGITRFTLPAELNAQELRDFASRENELVIYGYQALMQSAQCVQKNTAGCTKKCGMLYLRDRKNIRFPVLNRCLFCTNTIYNSIPLQLGSCRKDISRLAPAFLRLAFTIETSDETVSVLDQFLKKMPDIKGTKGHFKRGVE